MSREAWLRRQSCCASEPACPTCPLRPENARKSLRQLAAEALLGDA